MISLPNALTLGNLICGMASMTAALTGHPALGAAWILTSVIFDATDGWMARRMRIETQFGAYFDSVADFISFGLAPAALFLTSGKDLGWSAPLSLIGYVFACAYRLVRFHKQGRDREPGCFQGLPTTASGLIFALTHLWMSSLWIVWVLSALMVSRIPFAKPFAENLGASPTTNE